jgi:hypothetical protein
MRYQPATMEEVRKCLDYCPADMKVDVKSDVPLVAKNVGDLCSLSSWQPGLTLNFPSRGDRYPESVVVVERASQSVVLPAQQLSQLDHVDRHLPRLVLGQALGAGRAFDAVEIEISERLAGPRPER